MCHKTEKEENKVLCLKCAPIWRRNLDIEETTGEEVTDFQDVDLKKDGKDFLEG